MKSRGMMFGLLVGLLMLGLGHGAPAWADQLLNVKFPMSFFPINCNGAVVTIQGQEHVVLNMTQDANGGLHGTVDSDAHGTGTDTSGINYHFDEHDYTVGGSIQGTTGSFVATFAVDFNIISEGPTPNFISHSLVHMTFVNGQFTSVVFEGTTQCNG